MSTKHTSKRKQIIKKIAIYSMLLMLSLNLAFLEKENIKEREEETTYSNALKSSSQKKVSSDRTRNLKAYEYVKAKDYVNASKEFLSVIENTTNLSNTNEQLAYAYVNLAWSLNQLGSKEKSLWTLEQFLNIFKDSPIPYIQEAVKQAESILSKER